MPLRKRRWRSPITSPTPTSSSIPRGKRIEWELSEAGRARAARIAGAPWAAGIRRIASSPEPKAVETAALIAARLGLPVEHHGDLRESDRPSEGHLSLDDLDRRRRAFFADPEASANGWEPAREAQRRTLAAVESVLAGSAGTGDVLFVGHGRVGTLLLAAVSRAPISFDLFRPGGTGNLFAFDIATRRLLFGWRPGEA